MRVNPARHFRLNYATLAVLFAAAVLSTGCINKLKARDNLNSGVNAFKSGNYAEAADHFKTAIALDPTFDVARLYLATAYVQQYIPGTETLENKKYATEAIKEFETVLGANPDANSKLLATESMASLYYNMKDFTRAEEWNKKVISLDPKNKEAYYTLGVLAWTEFIAADREARLNEKMRPEDPAPLKDAKEREALKEKYIASLNQGIEYEKKALEIDPQYDNAMAYMNLLIRYRADLDDTKEQAASDVKEADQWVEKALVAQKANAAKKAAKT
ncbi:MAG: tetratricopeptide repeat protein, partial [Acidobacteriota bacterium]|nr:tetratricopeptide repeat protein [Acidobacteriota bacterium]